MVFQGVGIEKFLLVDTPCDRPGQGKDRAYETLGDRGDSHSLVF